MSTEAEIFERECELKEIEINLEGKTFTRLTQVVRNQYFKFLKNQLEKNMRTWQENQENLLKMKDHTLEMLTTECTKTLEDLALKEATVAQLYQRAMVKTIDIVRKSTKQCELYFSLQELLKSKSKESKKSISNIKSFMTKETQTDDENPLQTKAASNNQSNNTISNVNTNTEELSLDQRINLFQEHLNKQVKSKNENITEQMPVARRRHTKRHLSTQKSIHPHKSRHKEDTTLNTSGTATWHSPTPPLETVKDIKKSDAESEQLEGDEIAQELDKLFSEEDTDLAEIFGISFVHSQTNDDLNITKTTTSTSKLIATQDVEQSNTKLSEISNCNMNIDTETITTKTDKAKTVELNEKTYQHPQPVVDLRYSLWPCERFMQKRQLSAHLNRLIEEDIRWHDVFKLQFMVLFGEDNDEEFAACSPTLELDEVLLSSCVRRISPWVVRHLMKPLRDGLIGNRFLFKKLAKKLAHRIITEHQYPDEQVIKQAVEDFFCLHQTVMSAEDLNDIETMTINDV